MKNNNIIKIVLMSLLLFGYPLASYAYVIPNIATMLATLSQNLYQLEILIQAIAYVFGLILITSSIQELRLFGLMKGMMPVTMSVMQPIAKILVGTMLMFVPSIIDASIYTMWDHGSANIQAYFDDAGDIWQPVLNGVVAIIRTLGYIGVLQGLIAMSKSARQNAQPGTLAKGVIHLFGGIIAINIVEMSQVVLATFGFMTGS